MHNDDMKTRPKILQNNQSVSWSHTAGTSSWSPASLAHQFWRGFCHQAPDAGRHVPGVSRVAGTVPPGEYQ